MEYNSGAVVMTHRLPLDQPACQVRDMDDQNYTLWPEQPEDSEDLESEDLPRRRKDALASGATHYFTGKACRRGHLSIRNAHTGRCLVCDRENHLIHLERNPEARERLNARMREYRKTPRAKELKKKWDRLPEQVEKRRKKNRTPEQRAYMKAYNQKPEIQEYQKEYARKNKARLNARTGARRARRIRQTPRWAESEKAGIARLYDEATALSESTGIPHEVDHIVPLNHPEVSGLHCLANLRIITQAENRSKGNSFDPDDY